MSKENFSIDLFEKVAKLSLLESFKVISSSLYNSKISGYNEKENCQGVVSKPDLLSTEKSLPIIQKAFPELSINSKEKKGIKKNSRIELLHDPLDGSRPSALGAPTSTSILAAYDTQREEVIAVSTIDMLGRLWFSTKDKGTFWTYYDNIKQKWESYQKVNINTETKMTTGKEVVLIDATEGYKRKLSNNKFRQIITQTQNEQLSYKLQTEGAKKISYGSNGAHYTLTSWCRQPLVGCITVAKGGPFDIAPYLHVAEAGGIAQMYKMDNRKNKLINLENYDVERADICIAANNQENFNKLENTLKEVLE